MTISGDGLREVKTSSVSPKKRMVTPAGLGGYLKEHQNLKIFDFSLLVGCEPPKKYGIRGGKKLIIKKLWNHFLEILKT